MVEIVEGILTTAATAVRMAGQMMLVQTDGQILQEGSVLSITIIHGATPIITATFPRLLLPGLQLRRHAALTPEATIPTHAAARGVRLLRQPEASNQRRAEVSIQVHVAAAATVHPEAVVAVDPVQDPREATNFLNTLYIKSI